MAEPAAGALGRRRSAGLWSGLAALLLAASWAAGAVWFEIEPGGAWSLVYGVAAAALLAVTAAYGARRRMMATMSRWPLGNAAGWLAVHVWGGALFLLLVMLHSGFRWPSGPVTRALWLLSLWTVLSGIAGRLLQRWIPHLLASGLSIEVLYERIPELVAELAGRARELAAGGHEAIEALYERRIAAELEAPRRRWLYFVDITGGVGRRLSEFHHVRRLLPADERERLDRLEAVLRTKLELDAHYTLQRALRVWLVLHVPPAVVLVALVLVHLYAVLFY